MNPNLNGVSESDGNAILSSFRHLQVLDMHNLDEESVTFYSRAEVFEVS